MIHRNRRRWSARAPTTAREGACAPHFNLINAAWAVSWDSCGSAIAASGRQPFNESVYILSGEWEESEVTYTEGAFFFAPRGERHGPHVAKTEVVSLTMFDGPLTVA